MLQDVLAGKQTEIEETVEYVIAEGKGLGMAIPYNDFAYQRVKTIEELYNARL